MKKVRGSIALIWRTVSKRTRKFKLSL